MDDFDNNVSNIRLYKSEHITVPAQYDTYINETNQDNNYGIADTLSADDH
jgi:hypothetical protein